MKSKQTRHLDYPLNFLFLALLKKEKSSTNHFFLHQNDGDSLLWVGKKVANSKCLFSSLRTRRRWQPPSSHSSTAVHKKAICLFISLFYPP